MDPLRITAFFAQIQILENRQAAVREFAGELGIEDVLIFGMDVEIGIFLPAPGFSQTLPHAKAWRSFLHSCSTAGEYHATLPGFGEATSIVGIADIQRQCILVFVGGLPDPKTLVWIKALLPLLGAHLVNERVALVAKGHAEAARDASKKAAALNVALNINRHELNESMKRAENELVERRKVEAKLLAANRNKDEFLAMLAHELRNPLAPISNSAALLKLINSDRRVVETSEIIARQAAHMTELIDDLLDVSRVTQGLISLDKKTLDLRTLVPEAVEQVRSLIEIRKHQLLVSLPSEPVYVHGDRTRLVQIISNLVNNAAKYTPNGGKLSILVELADMNAVLTVSDNGIGIGEDLLPHVFDLFSQSVRTPDRSQGGLGIGLSLVKRLVELHGGNVTARSEASKGSEFKVMFPRNPMCVPTKDGGDNDSATPPHSSRLHVMIVDDNVDSAKTTAMLLEAWGHSVTIAYDAEAALKQTGLRPPSVLLLDIGLPDMDGYELARRLRSSPVTADATLIALTGYGQPEDHAKSRAAGFDFHLVKPTSAKDLALLLDSLR